MFTHSSIVSNTGIQEGGFAARKFEFAHRSERIALAPDKTKRYQLGTCSLH